MDAVDLEAWRIQRGLPGPAEMDEERNPLEAGLWDAVSFTNLFNAGLTLADAEDSGRLRIDGDRDLALALLEKLTLGTWHG